MSAATGRGGMPSAGGTAVADRAAPAAALVRRPDERERDPEDAALAAATRSLLDGLAPQLGLTAGDVWVHTGSGPANRMPTGARGLAEGSHVFLARGFDPALAHSRGLLAHELAHVAQQRDRRTAAPAPSDLVGAENEARALARASAAGAALWRPRARLPYGTAVADTGVATLPRSAAPSPKPAAAPPIADPVAQAASIRVGILRGRLGAIVARRYGGLLTRMEKYLSGAWVSGDDARKCLQLIDPLPFLVARELVSALDGKLRVDLARTLDDGHHKSYPVASLAALAALPPILLRELVYANVKGLDPSAFGPTERRAAVETLRGLRPPVLEELLSGPRKQVFNDLIEGPLLPSIGPDDESALMSAVAEIEKAEQETAAAEDVKTVLAKLEPLLAAPGQPDAVKALELMANVGPGAPPAPAKTNTGTAGPQAGTPAAVAPTRPEPPDPGPRLRRVVASLERIGAIGRLLDALGNGERWAGGPHAANLLLMLAARDPQRNLVRAEELLSYGILDWKIFDSEARYAYVLIRAVPLDLQDRWKRLDSGKWFARLEENIPSEDTLAGFYRGVGSRADAFDPDAAGEKNNGDLADAMKLVKAIAGEVSEKGVTGQTAVPLLRRILAVGRTAGQSTPVVAGAERRKIEIVVDRLDTLGHLDTILDALPDAYLLNEMWRSEVLELMAARDPRHLERHARRLLSYDWDHWAVVAREAWLAYYLYRSLPPAEQARFEAEDPDVFARLQAKMTAQMRASSAITNLGAKVTFETRDRLRDRLRDDEAWRLGRAGQLRSYIIQLYALDDRRWVFLRSRAVRADSVKGLERLVADLGLYHEKDRPDYDPEQLRSPDSGIVQLLAEYGRLIGVGLEVLWLARKSLVTDTIRVDDLDLSDLGWGLGGDIAGARVADRAEVKASDAKAGHKDAPKANALSFAVNDRAGIVTLSLPRLELTGLNRSFSGMSLRTGRISVSGLKIRASFSDRGYNRPVGATADFARADVEDTVVASEALGGTLGLTHLGVSPLKFATGATGAEGGTLTEKGKDGWIAIPVLDPFLRVLSHVISFMGTIPGLTSSIPLVIGPGDILTGPAMAAESYAARKFASFTTDKVATPILEGTLGLLTDGVFRPPRTVAERSTDAAAMLRSFAVSIGSLEVEGISLGGRQQIESLKVSNLLIGAGRSRPTVLRAERNSIDARLGRKLEPDQRTKLDRRRTVIEAELEQLAPLEAELDRLEARHRWDETSLSKAEHSRILELSTILRQTAGGSIDVGSIAVNGLSGMVNASGIDVGPIHAEAAGASRSGEYLPPEELVARFEKERGPGGLRDVAAGVTAQGSVGSVTVRPGAPGQPALRLELGVPTVAEVREQITALGTDARFADLGAALRTWVEPPAPDEQSPLERLAYLGGMASEPGDLDGVAIKGARTRKQEQEFQRLRRRAQEFFAITVGSLELNGITAVFDPARRGLGVEVASLTAKGVDAGALRIAEIEGRQVKVEGALDAAGGPLPDDAERVLAERGFPRSRPAVGFGAGSLAFKGVEAPGLDIKRVAVNGLSGRVETSGSTLRIPNLEVASAELDGLTYESAGRRMFALGATTTGHIKASVRVETVAVPKGPKAPEGGVIAGYRPTRMVVEDLRVDSLTADRLGMDVTAPKPGYSVEATKGTLRGIWVHDLVIPLEGNEVKITGSLGVEQVEKLRFLVVSRALRGGDTTIKGALDSPPPSGSRVGALSVDLLSSGGRTVDLSAITLSDGELASDAGTIKIRRAGIGGHIDQAPDGEISFSDVGPLRVEVAAIDWKVGSGQLRANGATVLEGLEASGRWKSEPDTEVDGKVIPGAAELHLSTLKVPRVTSDDLRYSDGVVDLHLGREKAVRPDLLEIRGLVVRDLHWSNAAGVTGGSLATKAARVEVGGRVAGTLTPATHIGAAATITDALYIKAALEASSIDLTFHEKGRIVARVRGAKAEFGVGGNEDADQYQGGVEGLDTGVIDIRRDSIEIGPEGSDGLNLGLLTLDKLSWNWAGSTGFGIKLDKGDGKITLAGTSARALVELHPPGHPGPRFKRLTLRKLIVSETRGTGLAVRLGDAVLRLDRSQEAIFGALELLPRADATGFVVEPKASGAGFDLLGKVNLGAFKLPHVAADIAGSLKATGDVAADGLTGEFMGVEGLVVKLARPSIANIEAQLTGDKALGGAGTHTVTLIAGKGPGGLTEYRLGAGEITFEDTDKPGAGPVKKLTVSDGSISGLDYTNSDLGLHIGVRSAKTPGDTVHDFLKGPKGSGIIPDLVIEDATFQADLTKLLTKSPAKAPPPPTGTPADQLVEKRRKFAADLKPYGPLINALNGSMSLTVNAGFKSIPFNLTFVDGALDYDPVQTGTLPAASPKQGLEFKMEGDRLVLQTSGLGYNVLGWDLPTGEVTRARVDHRIGVERLVNPTYKQQFFAEQVTAPNKDPKSDRLEITGIKADLTIKNPKSVALPLDAPNEVVLAANAITHLKVGGKIGGTDAAGVAQPGALDPISLEGASVERTKFVLTAAELSTGAIEITGLADTRLTFSGLSPRVLSGKVTRASAKKIEWSFR